MGKIMGIIKDKIIALDFGKAVLALIIAMVVAFIFMTFASSVVTFFTVFSAFLIIDYINHKTDILSKRNLVVMTFEGAFITWVLGVTDIKITPNIVNNLNWLAILGALFFFVYIFDDYMGLRD
jgi:hypothetical protein